MNQSEQIREKLAKRFPGLPITLDEPANEEGPWFLFVDQKDGRLPLSIEWRPDEGFGVSTPEPEDFGMGADEIYACMRETADRAITLIESGGSSILPNNEHCSATRRRARTRSPAW